MCFRLWLMCHYRVMLPMAPGLGLMRSRSEGYHPETSSQFGSHMLLKAISAKGLVLSLLVTAFLAGPALGDMKTVARPGELRILSSSGGVAASYADYFTKVRNSGQRVVIDGPCLSACTLVLGIVPRNRICVTKRAVLGFHAPIFVDRTGRVSRPTNATRAVTASYPASVRAWLRRKGGLRADFIYLRGPELASLYRPC